MELTINSQNYKLVFGVGFVRTMDKKYGLSNNAGFGLGMALTKAIPALEMYDPAALAEVIQCAADPSLSLADVDEYLDNPNTDIETLFKDVLAAIESANATKLAVKNLKSQVGQ
ncbi:tail assembly chaperone [Lactobacillus iners]|uniref:tail assembly chaperone n=1 Tax=Lactobacillus iners TaxID=147802 RepID=UPI0013E19D82|nr:tail assembly chaperone [Lactobacillus iners]QIH21221.1 hypothetical protein G6Z81_02205 [Lactobacillus iners]